MSRTLEVLGYANAITISILMLAVLSLFYGLILIAASQTDRNAERGETLRDFSVATLFFTAPIAAINAVVFFALKVLES